MIVAGLGFRSKASTASLRDALTRAGGNPDALATAAEKAAAPALQALSRETNLPIIAVADLTGQPTATNSPRVAALKGTGSVAEAAALAAAGPDARLIAPRVISADRMATAALATSHPAGTTA
jgi:cobalt-precorrin 5A hydrolase